MSGPFPDFAFHLKCAWEAVHRNEMNNHISPIYYAVFLTKSVLFTVPAGEQRMVADCGSLSSRCTQLGSGLELCSLGKWEKEN